MSVLDRVESLQAKKVALEAAISDESRRPHPSTETLKELKLKKLRIKDELEKLYPH
jgi:hypothetical protein